MKNCVSLKAAALFLLVASKLNASEPVNLPLLPNGQHLGYIEGFNAMNPQPVLDTITECWEEARRSGMQTTRIQLDWTDLEPKPREYDMNEAAARLELAGQEGMPIFLLITSADSDVLNYPEDLVTEDRENFVNGLRPNDPLIVSRFNTMLAQFIPLFLEHDVYAIAVGNEPDTRHEADPQFMLEFIDFVDQVRQFSHTQTNQIAITYTTTVAPVIDPTVNYADAIRGAVDVISINFYGVGGPNGLDLEASEAIYNGIFQLAGGKPVLIQELGFSSMVNPNKNFDFFPSSEEAQREFFAWVFPKLRETPSLRGAYVFQLVENDEVVDEIWREALAGLPEETVEDFVATFKGLGLVNIETGEKKPGWTEFITALRSNAGLKPDKWVIN